MIAGNILRLSFLTVAVCTSLFLLAQDSIFQYFFNKDLEPAKENKATYSRKITRAGNQYLSQVFKNNTPTFIEKFIVAENEPFIKNNEAGLIKDLFYEPVVYNGLKIKHNTAIDTLFYNNGKITQHATYYYYAPGKPSKILLQDYELNLLHILNFDSLGRIVNKQNFAGNKGIDENYDAAGILIKKDSLLYRDEQEASFPGGLEAWKRYLETNLNQNVPVENGAKRGTYVVTVQFIVEIDGKIAMVKPLTNFGHGMENEVVRVIKNSPDWEPARSNGRFVRAYRKQPITFTVSKK